MDAVSAVPELDWRTANAEAWDAYATAVDGTLVELAEVEAILEQLGRPDRLAEIRSCQGLLRMLHSEFVGRARELRAHRADQPGAARRPATTTRHPR